MPAVTRTRFGLTSRTVFTHAKILTLPTTTPTLIGAPGAGFVIVPMQAFFQMKWVADYTNIDATSRLQLGAAVNREMMTAFNEPTFGNITGIFAAGESSISMLIPVQEYNGAAAGAANLEGFGDFANIADFNNQPLKVLMQNVAAGDFTGGDPGNSLTITVFYSVVKLTL